MPNSEAEEIVAKHMLTPISARISNRLIEVMKNEAEADSRSFNFVLNRALQAHYKLRVAPKEAA